MNSHDQRLLSLGPYFNKLDDSLILDLLEYCDETSLLILAQVSRFFYVFAEHEDLWKTLCTRKWVKNKEGNFTFQGSWKITTLSPRSKSPRKIQQLAVKGFCSDRLYAKWYRGHVPIHFFELKEKQTVDRRSALKLSKEQFIQEYERFNKPVILTDCMHTWPAKTEWTKANWLQKYGNTYFKTNGTDVDGHCYKLTFSDYVAYMDNNTDDKPVYLFDNKFMQRAPQLLRDYEVPVYFKEDLFEYMKEEDRPDYRWILAGGPRSGSPLHQDPHRTSAWNALLSGRKRWILYPPDVIPPGVDEELIDTEYYASPEVMKWFIEIYPYLKKDEKPIECVQEAGEIIFVPSGWWHQVLNLEDTIAVTQNYCSPTNFPFVYQDMIRRKSNELRRQFYRSVQPHYPHLFEEFKEQDERFSFESDSSDSDSE